MNKMYRKKKCQEMKEKVELFLEDKNNSETEKACYTKILQYLQILLKEYKDIEDIQW